jgi:hypothetical protein
MASEKKAMKEVFLVHIFLPEVFSTTFYGAINEQRVRVNELMESRVLLSYSLDMDRRNVWAFFETDSRQQLNGILKTLPVLRHTGFEVHELAFHSAAPVGLTELIMN